MKSFIVANKEHYKRIIDEVYNSTKIQSLFICKLF